MLKIVVLLVVSLLQGQALAQSKTWTYGKLPNGATHYAVTTNDSGSLLLQSCVIAKGKCFWSIAITTSCDEDSVYPILVASDKGAKHMQLTCGGSYKHEGKDYYTYFLDFDATDRIVRSGASTIAIAMSLKSGSIRVNRFDLTDAVNAIDSMRAFARQQADQPQNQRKSTQDQYL